MLLNPIAIPALAAVLLGRGDHGTMAALGVLVVGVGLRYAVTAFVDVALLR